MRQRFVRISKFSGDPTNWELIKKESVRARIGTSDIQDWKLRLAQRYHVQPNQVEITEIVFSMSPFIKPKVTFGVWKKRT